MPDVLIEKLDSIRKSAKVDLVISVENMVPAELESDQCTRNGKIAHYINISNH